MSQPTAYYPTYNFTQYQASHPNTPLPGASVDSELFSISTSITEICVNLAFIQNSDGTLGNQTVGFNQLQSGLTIGLTTPATNWATATAYTVNNVVYQNNSLYVCAKAHTSTAFATDLAAGDWVLFINTGQYVAAAAASATAAAASAAQSANLTATSTTSQTPGSGAMTFTTQSGKFFNAGSYATITSNANPTVNFMNAQITSYSGTTLIVNVMAFGGSGAHTDWTINISGGPGATGATGAPGPGTGDMLKANNLSELASFATARTNLGLGSSAVQAVGFFAQVANNLSDVASAATAFANIKQAGTSSATGVLQLATNAQVVSGSDTALATTCAGVAAAMTAFTPANTIIGSPFNVTIQGGLIIKGGTVSLGSGGGTITFATAFPNGVYAVIVTPQDTGPHYVSVGVPSTSGVTVSSSNGAPLTYNYLAAGH